MRKRTRKRKTPDAFERVRHINTHKTEGLQELPESYTENKTLPKKLIYKTKYFWYPFITIIVATAISIDLHTHSFSDSFSFGWLFYDDSNDLKEYYLSHKAGIDSIFHYVLEREGKLAGIRYDTEGILLKMRSENYNETQAGRNPYLWHRNSTDFHSKNEAEVINGALKTDTYGYYRLYPDFWSYNLKAKRLRDINTTFMAHLETSYTELHSILTILAREHYEVGLNKGQPSVSLMFHAQPYELVRSPDTMDSELGPGIRVVKKARFSNLVKTRSLE